MNFRIGIGFDAHKFEHSRKLILAGTEIPYEQGLAGHSDADVLTHAVIDAVLGALSAGDIGQWFPDSSAEYKDADSLQLLKAILESDRLPVFSIVNVDTVIIAQKPKLSAFIPEMKKKLADILQINQDCVSVKATTTEYMGFCGRSEGIAAQAVVMLNTTPK
jgi:2-C-methyl-D-erythritol 2,4-cyclodiphosphate synthase